ncbi:MAG: 30S ribosomal protein S7 [Candidatus Marsarchaeota archaeon]|nr:30S ribosomal protein S7 [Candidatus Marsarchaeota archaeon]
MADETEAVKDATHDDAAGQKRPQARRSRSRARSEGPDGSMQARNTASGGAGRSGAVLLFDKYDVAAVKVTDQSVAEYIKFNKQPYPNLFGRRKNQAYYNAHSNIIERFMNKLMRGGTGRKVGGKFIRTEGRLQGKKLKVMHIVEEAFDSINKKTARNPIQVFVDALQNAAPIEDTTRVRYGGISYNVAVGISSNRRVDVALRNLALAALINAFNKRKKLSEALADELLLAADKAPDSYAIKKRIEGERIAKRAR